VDVEDGDVRAQFLDESQRFFAIASLADQPKTGVGRDHVAQPAADNRVIIGDQDSEWLAHRV
jgi:hypothetical protein